MFLCYDLHNCLLPEILYACPLRWYWIDSLCFPLVMPCVVETMQVSVQQHNFGCMSIGRDTYNNKKLIKVATYTSKCATCVIHTYINPETNPDTYTAKAVSLTQICTHNICVCVCVCVCVCGISWCTTHVIHTPVIHVRTPVIYVLHK